MFVRAYPAGKPVVLPAGPYLLLPFVADGELLVHNDPLEDSYGASLLRGDSAPDNALYLGDLDGVACLAYSQTPAADDDAVEPEGIRRLGLRALFGHLSDEETTVAG
ncbi:NUDIX-like domain-containing protein, partial [Armatimonas sp.]|uniref:NUDIX-like domain-containing protein n=1 Tax=Armatimonas sp. TaxID=1872638 RepID=UPI00375397F5